MCEPIGRDRSRDRGQVTILVVLAMGIFLLAFIGFATDYTNFWFHRQAVQGAADASCQAAAMDLLLYSQGQSTPAVKFTPVKGASIDCASAPTAAPCIIAKKNGYDGTLAANKVVMSFPASVAGATAPPGVAVPYVQVDVTEQVRTYFSWLLSKKSAVGVHANATCGLGALAGPVPLVVLHPTASGALSDFRFWRHHHHWRITAKRTSELQQPVSVECRDSQSQPGRAQEYRWRLRGVWRTRNQAGFGESGLNRKLDLSVDSHLRSLRASRRSHATWRTGKRDKWKVRCLQIEWLPGFQRLHGIHGRLLSLGGLSKKQKRYL